MRIRPVLQIRPIAIPMALLLVLITAGQILHVPIGTWLLSICRRYYGEYGYLAVFVGALLEGLLVVNFYVPGSTIVILGAVASRGGMLNIWAVIGLAATGFFLAHMVSFALGWYGWHSAIKHRGLIRSLEKTRRKLLEVGPQLVCAANIHPNLGALVSTAAGTLRVPPRKFVPLCGASDLAWATFWGLLAYSLGDKAVMLFNSWMLIPVLIIVLSSVLIGGRRGKPPSDGSSAHAPF